MKGQLFFEWLEDHTTMVNGRLYATIEAIARCHTEGQVAVINVCPRYKWHPSGVLCVACVGITDADGDDLSRTRAVLITNMCPSTSPESLI